MTNEGPPFPKADDAEPTSSASRVRTRTIERMQRLVGLAAIGAAACSSATSPPNNDGGYGVVDPMPMPARCAGGAAAIHGTATFEIGAGGKRMLVVRLAPPSDPRTTYGDPVPGGPLARVEGGGLELRVEPAPQALSYTFSFPVVCGEGPGALQADIMWTADIVNGAPLVVRIGQSYGY